MRFIENGPDIPDELLWAQDEGRVVFFCGAGVSMARADLPDFSGLLKSVFEQLVPTPGSSAEMNYRRFQEVGYPTIDSIFTEFENDVPRTNIHREVARALKPNTEDPDLSAHRIILKLAKQNESGIRLVTTNFDRLFEAAAPRLPCLTRSTRPNIEFGVDAWGIMHLHGVVTPDYEQATPDGFILNSREFGSAYLSNGWARDFVAAVLDKYVPVFVGYRADDPPISYLLEGLHDSGGPQHKAYAFESGNADQVAARWENKSVIGIPYEQDQHDLLWDTLEAWSKRSVDPKKWRKGILRRAQKGPENLRPHERGMVAHLVRNQAGATAFRDHEPAPPASWLCVFGSKIRYSDPKSPKGRFVDEEQFDPFLTYGLDSDLPPQQEASVSERRGGLGRPNARIVPEEAWDAFKPSAADLRTLHERQVAYLLGPLANTMPNLPSRLSALGGWIAKVAYTEIGVWWCARHKGLHPEVIRQVVSSKEKNLRRRAAPAVNEAWSLLLTALQTEDRNQSLVRFDLYNLSDKIKAVGWNTRFLREYLDLITPTLRVEDFANLRVPPQNGYRYSRRDLVHFDVDYTEDYKVIRVPDELLKRFCDGLLQAILVAIELELEIGLYLEVRSFEIEEDDDDDDGDSLRDRDLTALMRLFIESLRRLAKLNAKAARTILRALPSDDKHVGLLKLWLASLPELASPSLYCDIVSTVSDDVFWEMRGERDLLLGLKRRWDQLDLEQRKSIEGRICRGYPGRGPREQRKTYRGFTAHQQLDRFHWLKNADCKLSFDLEKFTTKTRKLAPDWNSASVTHAADDHRTRIGWVGRDDNVALLEDVALKDVIAKCGQLAKRDFESFTDIVPFQGLSKSNRPARALGALKLASRSGVFPARYWTEFLQSEARTDDVSRAMILIAGRLLALEQGRFEGVLFSATRWIEKCGVRLRQLRPSVYSQIWERSLSAIQASANLGQSTVLNQDTELVTPALNAPSGFLAQMVMEFPEVKEASIKDGFDPTWKRYVQELVDLPDPAGAYALAIFCLRVPWFYHYDQEFAETLILQHLTSQEISNLRSDAAWSGLFLRGEVPQPSFYVQISEALIRRAIATTPFRRKHREGIAGFLLVGWGAMNDEERKLISDQDLRKTLIVADNEFRLAALSNLRRWTGKPDARWNAKFPEFLRKVWPRQRSARTRAISAGIINVIVGMETHFDAAVFAALDLLSECDPNEIYFPPTGEKHRNNLAKHPDAASHLLYAALSNDRAYWPYGAKTIIDFLEPTGKDPEAIRKLRILSSR